MEFSEIAFLIGNIICSIGTIDLIRGVIKNRDSLRGYTLRGGLLTFVALLWFGVGFANLNQWLSVFFASITIAYWFFVTAFQIKYRKTKRKKSKLTFIFELECFEERDEMAYFLSYVKQGISMEGEYLCLIPLLGIVVEA